MMVFKYASTLPFSPDTVYLWHSRPGALQRLVPAWQDIQVVQTEGEFENARIHLKVRKGPLTFTWLAQHEGAEAGRQFVDVQIQGPFQSWRHTHRFEADGEGCRLLDHIEYQLPWGAFIGAGAVCRMLARMFEFRHTRIREDLARHAPFASRGALRVAISGATGLIGTALEAFLQSAGHHVLRLTRGPARRPDDIVWDPQRGRLDATRLEGLDAVVHLAGHSIGAQRWTAAEKARILDSRVDSTRLLSEALSHLSQPPAVLVSGSAVGYYGGHADAPKDETAEPGSGFLASVCRQWEEATTAAGRAGIRTVHLRTGLVLTALLGKLKIPFSFGLGATMGDGHQQMSWVSIDDLVAIIHTLIMDSTFSGPVNATAPNAVSAKTFSTTLGRVMHRPALLHIPQAVISTALGDMGREVLLEGVNVVPRQLLDRGFTFNYPHLEHALRHELP